MVTWEPLWVCVLNLSTTEFCQALNLLHLPGNLCLVGGVLLGTSPVLTIQCLTCFALSTCLARVMVT